MFRNENEEYITFIYLLMNNIDLNLKDQTQLTTKFFPS